MTTVDAVDWIRLGEKAHCRFGDKGDTGLFVVSPYHTGDFDALVAALTQQRLSHHFGGLSVTQIQVRSCLQLTAVVIAMHKSLGGGVTRSLALDIHGKTRSGYLLGMLVPWG